MRLGVLDVGSNTVHLLLVDARRGGHPTPTTSERAEFAASPNAAPSSAGTRARRLLTDVGLLEGVSPSRAHQLVAGALVAEASMRALQVTQPEICPWALREGVLRRPPEGSAAPPAAQTDRSAHDAPGGLGRLTTYEARCTG